VPLLLLHAGDPHAFPSGAREEVHTGGEAEPGDTGTDEKRRDPIMVSNCTPPFACPTLRGMRLPRRRRSAARAGALKSRAGTVAAPSNCLAISD
jgi:hypothetical protein